MRLEKNKSILEIQDLRVWSRINLDMKYKSQKGILFVFSISYCHQKGPHKDKFIFFQFCDQKLQFKCFFNL